MIFPAKESHVRPLLKLKKDEDIGLWFGKEWVTRCYPWQGSNDKNLNVWNLLQSGHSGNQVNWPDSAKSGSSVYRILKKEWVAHKGAASFTAPGILPIRNSLNPNQQPLQSDSVLIRPSSFAFGLGNSQICQNLCTHRRYSPHQGPIIPALGRD